MPYEVVPKGKGFVVMSQDSGKQLSKRPLTRAKANQQRVAVALAEHRKHPGVPLKRYFA